MTLHELSVETPRTADGTPNRLKGMRGYLAGAMDRVKDGGVQWRIDIQEAMSDLEIVWMDPTCKPIEIGVEDMENREKRMMLKGEGRFDEVAVDMKIIRCVDLRMVDLSDFLVINIDISVHQCGTYEEFTTANRQKKPCIVHVEQGKQHTPDWLLGKIPHSMIFSTWFEVRQYLRHIAHDKVVDTKRRWYFFNYDLCRRF